MCYFWTMNIRGEERKEGGEEREPMRGEEREEGKEKRGEGANERWGEGGRRGEERQGEEREGGEQNRGSTVDTSLIHHCKANTFSSSCHTRVFLTLCSSRSNEHFWHCRRLSGCQFGIRFFLFCSFVYFLDFVPYQQFLPHKFSLFYNKQQAEMERAGRGLEREGQPIIHAY